MDIFKQTHQKIGKWIQVLDKANTTTTIEDFDYGLGVHGPITLHHCEKCVSANKCWFKDEKDKKPAPYPITSIKWLDDIANAVTPGLYHYNCHCYENAIISPSVEDIELVIPKGKDQWLYKDKSDLILSLGYDNNNEFLKTLCDIIKQTYCDGNYKIIEHTNYGVKINLFLTVPGRGIKAGKTYNIKSAFMIFPNGKLKCNTFIGGWWK